MIIGVFAVGEAESFVPEQLIGVAAVGSAGTVIPKIRSRDLSPKLRPRLVNTDGFKQLWYENY